MGRVTILDEMTRPRSEGSTTTAAPRLYLARPRRRHCRVGATHRPHTVYGGLHPPYKWVTSARVRYNKQTQVIATV